MAKVLGKEVNHMKKFCIKADPYIKMIKDSEHESHTGTNEDTAEALTSVREICMYTLYSHP